MKRNGKFVDSRIEKKHCGTFVRVTSVGNAQLSTDLVEVQVAGRSIYALPAYIRMGAERYKGGEPLFQARQRAQRR